jgi:two-component system nitrogen regulation sensor histidine kinase NtrY
MAGQLERNRARLVYLTQVASWRSLARKTAHELKNSLTPIRLTVEELLARQNSDDRGFMEQAAGIVVNEIETLERRVRAFSEFSSEPEVDLQVLDVNALVEERIALLRPAHPNITYDLQLDRGSPQALADMDRVKGILTNVFENAAEAAGERGAVLATTSTDNGNVMIEVHDSGPGLGPDASRTLFEPTITFKKDGMGLGLSIARKNALLSGGDIMPIVGVLGGAAFRIILTSAEKGNHDG